MNVLLVVLYLLLSFSAWVWLIKFFTMTRWECINYFDKSQGYKKRDGFDITWCEIFWFSFISLIPVANIFINLYWLYNLYEVYRDHHEGRHLFSIPKIKFTKCKLPKCSIAVKGKKA